MAIKHALLGLLADEARHGYALHAAFAELLGDLRELHFGQLYQVLRGLERDRYITAHEEQLGSRPIRRVYELTKKGRSALERWLAGKTPAPQPDDDEIWMRLSL